MSNPPPFLSSLLERYKLPNKHPRPHVTLTFAQSIDAKIAGKGGKQLMLSGKDSMIMTHWMRTMHDGILVGIGTALNDDPQLNTRHLPPREPDLSSNGHDSPYHVPRPIILDSDLRLPPRCKLLRNYNEGGGRKPWIACVEPTEADKQVDWRNRRKVLENAGARIVALKTQKPNAYLPVDLVLETLQALGIRSVMVEGGAQVIKSFFSHPAVVDTVIVTVAPTFVGEAGVSYNAVLDGSTFKHSSTEMFGRDTVIALIPA